MRDPSGQMFLRLPSTTPEYNAFFVSWTGQLVQVDRVNGLHIIGGCQFQNSFVPQNPFVGIYRPPIMSTNLGVETPGGFVALPRDIVDPNRPYASVMITGQPQTEACFRAAWHPDNGLNRDQFGDCMVGAMAGGREVAAYRCMRMQQSPEARAFCMIKVLGGNREQRAAEALERCFAQFGTDWSRYPLCMANVQVGGDAGRLLACVQQQSRSGDVTVMGTAMCYGAQSLNLNPEMQIVVQCAVATGGEPYAFTACAGGQLTARELDKCLRHGVGGPNGCFGPNNDIINGLREAGRIIAGQFGPNNDIVRTWNSAVQDITRGPGPNNEGVRVLRNVGNEIGRAPDNVGRAISRAVPRVRVKL